MIDILFLNKETKEEKKNNYNNIMENKETSKTDIQEKSFNMFNMNSVEKRKNETSFEEIPKKKFEKTVQKPKPAPEIKKDQKTISNFFMKK